MTGDELAKLLPYFRWYPADAESDNKYAAMSLAELGLFHRCLNHSWLNDGIAPSVEEMARELRIPEKEIRPLWPRVSRCFVQSPADERLRNLRQEEERNAALTKSERNTNAVRTRYERTSNVPTTVPQHARARAESGSVSVFDSESASKIFEERFISAFSRHRKHRATETKILVSQMLLDVNWDSFDAAHIPFCEFWDRHDWTKCPLTMLEWYRNGMPGPPPEAKNSAKPEPAWMRED